MGAFIEIVYGSGLGKLEPFYLIVVCMLVFKKLGKKLGNYPVRA